MISLIVLHCNKSEYSRACLHSLLESSARPLEIINVDNGSREDTPRVLANFQNLAKEAGIETQTLTFEENIGAVRGRNEALKVARGEFLVFLDNDTLIAQTNWLETLRDFLRENPNRAIAAPKLLFPWQPFRIECCGVGVSKRGRIQYIGRGENRDAFSSPFQLQSAISAAWMMPRFWLEKIGPLDEEYSPVQYEDIDFCYRARSFGGEVWAVPRVELYHFEHTTTAGSDDINFKYVTTRNGMLFKKRWSEIFSREDGPQESETAWLTLEKRGLEEIDWSALRATPK